MTADADATSLSRAAELAQQIAQESAGLLTLAEGIAAKATQQEMDSTAMHTGAEELGLADAQFQEASRRFRAAANAARDAQEAHRGAMPESLTFASRE